jgi:hypothetical protein
MKTLKMKLLIGVMAFASLTIATYADDAMPDYIWGSGGYVNSLSRVQAKGSPKEQDSAVKQAEWLDQNQRQVKELMQWLYLNHKLKVSPD